MFSLTGTRSDTNLPPRSSHGVMPPADHTCRLSPCVGIGDPPGDEPETEGFFSNGGVYQGRRPVITGCPILWKTLRALQAAQPHVAGTSGMHQRPGDESNRACPIDTGCPMLYSHATGTREPRRPGDTNSLFAVTDSETQGRGSFGNGLNYHHDGREEWDDLSQWIDTTTLAHECSRLSQSPRHVR